MKYSFTGLVGHNSISDASPEHQMSPMNPFSGPFSYLAQLQHLEKNIIFLKKKLKPYQSTKPRDLAGSRAAPAAAMPPKAKKKQSAASPQPSPRTPASRGREGGSVAAGGGDGGGTLDLPSVAAAAAARHPALVPRGGEGCFSGTVAEVAPRGRSRGGEARLWLSEPAMVGAALRPGCLVSVSSCLMLLLLLEIFGMLRVPNLLFKLRKL